MKKITLRIFITCLSVLAVIAGCRKNERENDNETQSSSDMAMADFIFNDVYKQVYSAGKTDSVLKIIAASCDTTYILPAWPDNTFPKTMTIRFDTVNGCTGSDGIVRKGTITAVFTGMMKDSLSQVTITFYKYYVNGNKIEGTKTITNKGTNANGNPYFTVSVSGATITTAESKKISWSSYRTREWISGDTTSAPTDDVYSITGTASGTSITGNTFTMTTGTALRVEAGCQYPTSGTVSIQPGGNALLRKIDFGSGTCDKAATVSFGGKTYDITLP